MTALPVLSLDFNRLGTDGCLRIAADGAERANRRVLAGLKPGARVLVVDDEGNSCEGVLEPDGWLVVGVRVRVRLDLATWEDAG